MKKKLRATAAMMMKGTKTTSIKLKRVDKNARNLFVRFFQNPQDPLKLMTIFNYFQIIQQRRLTFYRISYECNSSSPMTFFEIRLYAIVILLQYLLIMFVACSTFFSRTASNKVNIRLTKRIFHFSVEDLVNYSKNMKL